MAKKKDHISLLCSDGQDKIPGIMDQIKAKIADAKQVGLVIHLLPKGMLQFPDGVTHSVRQHFGIPFLVVYNGEDIIGKFKLDCVQAVYGPTTLFRDGRWN